MIGELPKHKLNAVQKKNVEMAQSYLLKLMTAKEKQPHEFQDVINQLGQKNRYL